MRRKDREISDFSRMIEIVRTCDCCRLGLLDTDEAYIVPMNFGFTAHEGQLTFYFHGAAEGRKIKLIRNQPRASFEMDRKHKLLRGDTACAFSYRYQSVMGKGDIRLIESYEEKIRGLQTIMAHYSADSFMAFEEKQMDRVCVIRLDVTHWSCKAH